MHHLPHARRCSLLQQIAWGPGWVGSGVTDGCKRTELGVNMMDIAAIWCMWVCVCRVMPPVGAKEGAKLMEWGLGREWQGGVVCGEVSQVICGVRRGVFVAPAGNHSKVRLVSAAPDVQTVTCDCVQARLGHMNCGCLSVAVHTHCESVVKLCSQLQHQQDGHVPMQALQLRPNAWETNCANRR